MRYSDTRYSDTRNSYTRYSGGAGKLTYCVFFDKSTKFGTEVDQHIISVVNRYPDFRISIDQIDIRM